jgi:catalase (peroxidase I)
MSFKFCVWDYRMKCNEMFLNRALLEPIKLKYNWISYGDLWTLAGVVAVEAMGGPVIPWKPGI